MFSNFLLGVRINQEFDIHRDKMSNRVFEMSTKNYNLKEHSRMRSEVTAETWGKIRTLSVAIQRTRSLIDVMRVNAKALDMCGIEMTTRVLAASQSIFLPSMFFIALQKFKVFRDQYLTATGTESNVMNPDTDW